MTMAAEAFAEQMTEVAERDYDVIEEHIAADDLMCEVLRSLGYEAGVAVFKGMSKYYS